MFHIACFYNSVNTLFRCVDSVYVLLLVIHFTIIDNSYYTQSFSYSDLIENMKTDYKYKCTNVLQHLL